MQRLIHQRILAYSKVGMIMRVIIQEMNSSLVIPSLQIVNQSHRAANHLMHHT